MVLWVWETGEEGAKFIDEEVRDLPYYGLYSELDADKEMAMQTESREGAGFGRNCIHDHGIHVFGAGIQIFKDLHRG